MTELDPEMRLLLDYDPFDKPKRHLIDDPKPEGLDEIRPPSRPIYDCLTKRERQSIATKYATMVKHRGYLANGSVFMDGNILSIWDLMLREIGYRLAPQRTAGEVAAALLAQRGGLIECWNPTQDDVRAHKTGIQRDMDWLRSDVASKSDARQVARETVRRMLGVTVPDGKVTHKHARAYKAKQQRDLR